MDLNSLSADQLMEALVQIGQDLARTDNLERRLELRRIAADIKVTVINRIG